MGIASYDPREFESTYFALRIGLMFSTVLVLLAPLSVRIYQGQLPPSISDSWYTDARSTFVIGLAAAACLLVVVRGDTLTEQTLLNIAGGLGLIVAGVACWPKDESGESLPSYDPVVAQFNQFALGSLLVTGVLVWLVGTRLPAELRGSGWHVTGTPKVVLRAAYPILLGAGLVAFVIAGDQLAERAHGPAAVTMFVLLGCVALLRTSAGVRLLERIGDTPVDDSLTAPRIDPDDSDDAQLNRFDSIYVVVAGGMFAVVAIAVMLVLREAKPGWVVLVEAALLVLFGVFWGVQTWEAWVQKRRRSPQPTR